MIIIIIKGIFFILAVAFLGFVVYAIIKFIVSVPDSLIAIAEAMDERNRIEKKKLEIMKKNQNDGKGDSDE
jgi:hypothetical protein